MGTHAHRLTDTHTHRYTIYIVCVFILQEFRRISLCGYVLNAEQDNFYFMSLSRHHPQRIQASRRLSKPATTLPAGHPCSAGGRVEEAMLEKEAELQPLAADSEVSVQRRKPIIP